MKFKEKYYHRLKQVRAPLCVGLDPDLALVPERFKRQADPLFEFCRYIIDETQEFVAAFKPNSAFFEAEGARGITSLKLVMEYLHDNYPSIPVILDAKRGDIGHTNRKYAQFIFDYLGVDAVTLQPYLGSEALQEFFPYQDKGLIILCRTSNPGAGEFQDLLVDGQPLWQKVALAVTKKWSNQTEAELMLVVGATYPEELKTIRQLAPETLFLIPGIGSQGGDLQQTLANGLDSSGRGVIINSSRGIIFDPNPRQAAQTLREQMLKYLA